MNINYNFGIHYTEIEQKQLKKKSLPPLYYNFIMQNDEKCFGNNISSRSNRNIKVKPNDINHNNYKVKKVIIEENKNNSKKIEIDNNNMFNTIENCKNKK